MVRAWPCKHGVPVQGLALEECQSMTAFVLAAAEALEAQEILLQIQFSPWALIKGWLEPPPCLHSAPQCLEHLLSSSKGCMVESTILHLS